MTCKICGKENPKYIWYCEEHYLCANCGTRDNLLGWKNVLCRTCDEKRIAKRIAEFDGDTELEFNAICPHCGYEHMDSWDMGEGENNCYDCERLFNMERVVDVSYTTTKINRKPEV